MQQYLLLSRYNGRFREQQRRKQQCLHYSIFKYKFVNLFAYNRQGRGFRYEDISGNIRQLLQQGKPITEMTKYLSPTTFLFGWTKHLEVILRIETSVYMVISFGQDGLEICYSINKQALIDRRKNNWEVDYKQINSDTVVLKNFIIYHQGWPFRLLEWNCHYFGNDLWDQLNRNQRRS